MKKYIGFLLVIFSIFGFCMVAHAKIALPETVRVGLYFGSSAPETVTVSADGGVYIMCDSEDLGWLAEAEFTQSEGVWTVLGGEEPVEVAGDKIVITSAGGYINVMNKPYRGQIELVPNGGKITVVNHLNIEEYLYGVVPLEMSTGWPLEALKNQAVCARTYVAKNLGKYSSQGFDVYNNTMSQVYGGVSVEKSDCTKAVDETKGLVITYGGQLIDAVYFSTSSNFHTFNVKDVWGGSHAYLVGVDDSYQRNVKPDCSAWVKTVTPEEVETALSNKKIDIGKITDMKINSVSPEGAITELEFVGSNGSYLTKRDESRTILSLRSQSYTIDKITEQEKNEISVIGASGISRAQSVVALNSGGMLVDVTKVLSSNGLSDAYSSQTDAKVSAFVLSGTGYGHGIGMSQYGANGMAKAGFTFDQIIKHYYTGVEIE